MVYLRVYAFSMDPLKNHAQKWAAPTNSFTSSLRVILLHTDAYLHWTANTIPRSIKEPRKEYSAFYKQQELTSPAAGSDTLDS